MKNDYNLKSLTQGVKVFCTMLLLTLVTWGNVFAQSQYELVSADQDDWSGTYLLTGPKTDGLVTLSGFSTSSTVYGTYESVATYVTTDGIESNATTDANQITIAKVDGQNAYTMLFKGEYIGWTSGNSLAHAAAASDDHYYWTIYFDGSNLRISNVNTPARLLQWNNGSPRFACYTSNQMACSLYKLSEAAAISTPTFTPAAGNYYAAQTVSIACETEGANIYYTIDGTEPTASSTLYTAPITVNTTTTIKAIAIDGTESSHVGTAIYNFPAFTEVADLATFKRTANNTDIYKVNTDLTVLFQTEDKYHTFIQDSSAAIYVYGTMDKKYSTGDVIEGGMYGKYSLYSQMNEMKPVPGSPIADGVSGSSVIPNIVTLDSLIANYDYFEGRLVTVKNLVVSTTSTFTFSKSSSSGVNVTDGENTIQIYNTFKTLDCSLYPNNRVTVTGLVIRHNDIIEIAPRTNSDIWYAPATVPYVCDFDDNNDPGWTLVNTPTSNDKWYIGQAQGFDNNKLYISSTNGATNKYDVDVQGTVIAFRQFEIPAEGAFLNMKIRSNGETAGDYLHVYITKGDNNKSWEVALDNDWTDYTFKIPARDYEGTSSLFVAWVNNGNGQGEQTPAAIDNITLDLVTCVEPLALNVSTAGDSAIVTWTPGDSTNNNWTLEYKLEEHSEWYTMNLTAPTATLHNLQGNSTYNLRVRTNCGEESSLWNETTFQSECLTTTTSLANVEIIGESTNNSNLPFYGLYGYSYSQQIITAEEIGQPDGGRIMSISFNCATAPSATGNIRIWLGHTDKTSFDSNTDFISPGSLSQVAYLEGAYSYVSGWNTINFNTPFSYNGTDNLVVAYYEGMQGYNSSAFKAHQTSSARAIYEYNDNESNVSYTNPAGASGSKNRVFYNNDIKFNMRVAVCNDQIACAAPTNLTVSNIDVDAATISWEGEAANYELSYKTGEDDWNVVLVNGNEYTLSNLTQKTAYTVRVKAICRENDESVYSDEVEFSTTSVCPIVTDITSSNISTTTTISWTPGGSETAWVLRFRPQGEEEWINLNIGGLPSTTFGGLMDQTTYEVEIMALCDPNDEENQSSWAPYQFVSGCAAFDVPYIEKFEAAEIPACWDANGFTFADENANGEEDNWLMTPPMSIPAVGNTYIVMNVKGNVTVKGSYRGTALNRFMDIATINTNEVAKTIIGIPATYNDKAVNFLFVANGDVTIEDVEFTSCPFVPANLVASNPTDHSVELTWNGTYNNGWVIEYAEEGSDIWTAINVADATDTVTYSVTDLDANTTYMFRVRTVCAGDFMGEPSKIAMAHTYCKPIPVPFVSLEQNNANFDCWSTVFTGTYPENGASLSYSNQLDMYNFYNATIDAADIDAFGNVYAILPKFDTTLNVLQITFDAYDWYEPGKTFQLGVVTDVNDPLGTFQQLAEYTADFNAVNYGFILNNAPDGNLAFRLRKSDVTQRVRIFNVKVDFIPACQTPNSLTVTPASESSVDVTWTNMGRTYPVQIKYNNGSFDPETSGTSVNANLQPRTITGLEYGETYTFYIRQNCATSGYSDWYGPVTQTLEKNYILGEDEQVTTCHGNIVVSDTAYNEAVMTILSSAEGQWPELAGEFTLGLGEVLYVYDGNAVDPTKLIQTVTGSFSGYIVPQCETSLTLRLTGNGPLSDNLLLSIECASVPTCSAPSKPEFDLSSQVLTWEPGCWGTPTGYNVEVIDNTAETTSTLSATTTSVLVATMPNDHEITFRVQPICADGVGDWSNESDVYVKMACGAPQNLNVVYDITSHTATLTWTPYVSTQNNFVVEYQLNGAYSWNITNVTGTSFTSGILDNPAVYNFRVKALCATEESEYSTITLEVECENQTAQPTEVAIGEGTGSTYYLPVDNYFKYSYTQQIFDASEIGSAGTISAVSFQYKYSTPNSKKTRVNMYLGHTNKSEFASTTDYVSFNDLQLVYSGELVCNTGWNTFTFDAPFEYNGTDNLVLVVDDNSNDYNSSSYVFYSHTTTGYKSIYHHSDSQNADPQTPPSASGRLMYRNNVKFQMVALACDEVVACPSPTLNEDVTIENTNVVVTWTAGGSETSWMVVYSLNNGDNVIDSNVTTNSYSIPVELNTGYNLHFEVFANCDLQSIAAVQNYSFTTPPCLGGTTVNLTGTSSSQYLPSYAYYKYSYSQQIYLASEINQPRGGQIRAITLEVDRNSATRNLNVYLMNTTAQSITAFEPINNATLVFSGNKSLSGVVTFEFSTPFDYNGTDNLMLIVDDNTNSYNSSYPYFKTHTAHNNCSRYIYSDNTNYDPTGTISGGTALSVRNNIQFTICPPLPCSAPSIVAFDEATNTLTWSAGAEGTPESYNIQYRKAGTNDPYVTVSTTEESYVFTDLETATTYEIGVQTNCGETDGLSSWKTITVSIPCETTCLYTVEMTDSYGDGWNGNSIQVFVGGVQSQTLTISSGNSNVVTVEVCGEAEFRWSTGSYPQEASFIIYDPDMNEVYACSNGSTLSNGSTFYTTPSCVPPTCSVPTSFVLTQSGNDYIVSWSAGTNGTPESYNFQYRLMGDEEFTTVVLTDTLYTFVNPVPGSIYEFQVQANCGSADGESKWSNVMSIVVPADCSQTFDVPFVETFDFNSTTIGCWTIVDRDHDGHTWGLGQTPSTNTHNGSDRCAISASYDNDTEMPLNPDNWLISPAINVVENSQLRYWLRGQDASYAEEYYSVYVATDADITAFLATLPVDSGYATGEYVETVIDLSAYAGQTVHVAFRHHNVTDMFYLNLDDVSIILDPCAGYTITEANPYTEDFEEYTGSGEIELDNCWYSDGAGYTAGNGVKSPFVYGNYSYAAHSGSNSMEMKGNQGMVVLPVFTNDVNTLSMTFWANRVSTSYTDNLVIGVITDINDPTTFVSVDTLTSVGTRGNTSFIGPIVFSNVPANGRIALRYTSTGSTQSWNFDDFTVYLTPTCFTPENLEVSNITANSAKISWTDPEHQTNYAVEYKEEDATVWTTIAGDTSNHVELAGLDELTTYNVRMKAVCGEGDESQYTDEISFTTHAIPATLPYNFSFDSADESGRWQLVNGTQTNKWIVGNATGNGDSNALYVTDDNGENNHYTNSATSVWAYRDFEADSAYKYELSFDWKGYGEGNFDYLQVFVGEIGNVTAGSSSAPTGTSRIAQLNQNNEWSTFNIDLGSDFSGYKRIYFLWKNDGSGGQQTPAAIDNISIVAVDKDLQIVSIEPILDNCDLSEANVTVKVNNHTFSDVVNGFTAMYVLNGTDTISETVNATIEPNGTYTHTFATIPEYSDGSNNIQVTIVYDGDMDLTNNTLTLANVNLLVPETVPYTQNFTAVQANKGGWNNFDVNEDGVMMTMDNAIVYTYNDTLDANDWMMTPCFELPAGNYVISYDYAANSNLNEAFEVKYGFGATVADMTELINTHNFSGTETNTASNVITIAADGVYNFGFHALSEAGNLGFSIDNFSIMPVIDVVVTAGEHGTVTPLGTIQVPYNEDLTINIIPDEMYHTAGVWVDGERVMNEDPFNASFMMYTLENITEPHTINVEFKMEFHIFKYVYNYSDQYPEVGGYFVPATPDTLLDPTAHTLTMVADENYSLHSLVVGTIPPASEGAIIDGENVIADVTFDPATGTYTYTIDTMYVANYYVQACFKIDTVNIHYTSIAGTGVFDGVTVAAGESYDTWVDIGADHTSTIAPADGFYTMAVTVNAVNTGIIDHYDFEDITTTQYVSAQFGHMVTTEIANLNGNSYLGSDDVRGTIEPDTQYVVAGYPATVTGTIDDHFHLYSFLVNGVNMINDVQFDGNNFTYTIDSLDVNTHIQAFVAIDSVAIIYIVDGGHGYVNGNPMNAVSYDTLWIDYMSDYMNIFQAADGYSIINVTVNGIAYNAIPQWSTEMITEPQYITITFGLNEYDIITMADGAGVVSPSVHITYDPNYTYTFTATPAIGHHISQIIRNGEELTVVNPEAVFTDVLTNILNDYTYMAFFEPNVYTITASAGEGGTIDPFGPQNYVYGSTPTYTIIPAVGYAIDEVTVDGAVVTLTNGTYTFAALTGDHTIHATFVDDNYTITASAGNGGSITPSGAVTVAAGSSATFDITPATGYVIADVEVDGASVGAVSSYTFEDIAANHTIEATFTSIMFNINATAGVGGTISNLGNTSVAYGSTPTYTITPAAGYAIDYVTVDGAVVTLTNNAYTFAPVTANHTIHAAFTMLYHTITVTAPNNGTITPSGVVTVAHNATPSFTVTPNLGYEVTAITVGNTNVINNAQATGTGAYVYTFPAVTADQTLTATMTLKTFTITATAGAHGSINGPTTVNYGQNAAYTITPDEDYEVLDVVVDGISVGARTSYIFHNVTANHTIAVTFKVENCIRPYNLQVINIDTASATLTWYHPSASSYDIRYKTITSTTWTMIQNVPGFSYDVTNLQSGTNYVWQVKANSLGCTDADWSNANTFKTNVNTHTPDGVVDYVKNHVRVFAVNNNVNIVNDYNIVIENVDIYDMYGKLIYNGHVNNNPEVIGLNVATGTYIVRLTTDQGPAVYKLFITK